MSYLESKELLQVKKLIDECKLDEADRLIKNFEEKGGQTLHDRVLCNFLKCELLSWRGLHEDVVKLAERVYKESLGLAKTLLSVDILLTMALSLLSLAQTDKAHGIIKEGEDLLKTLTQESAAEYKQREAYVAFQKGWVYSQKLDVDRALKQFELSLSLREELGIKHEIAWSLYGIAHIYMVQIGDLDRALTILERGKVLADESGNKRVKGGILFYMAVLHKLKGELDDSIMIFEQVLTIYNDFNNNFMIIRVLSHLGDINAMRGELNRSIKNYQECLEILKKLDNKFFTAGIFNNLASIYKRKGDLNRAIEYVELAMALLRKLGTIDFYNNHLLIQILIEMGDFERVQNALRDFEQLTIQLKEPRMTLYYLLDKALVLKTSSRALNRGKAEEILKDILENKDLRYDINIEALLNLCGLLLFDLQISNEAEVLEEIKPLITQLLDLSKKSHSFWILGETYLLQAKLAIISLNLEEARRFLTQGQQIAEKYGLTLLARKISHEHDELLTRLDVWENLKDLKAPISERMKLARPNEQMERMIRKREINVPKLSDEDPVLLLIISEGGTPIFSQSFTEDQAFEDHLFGGFFTAINSFISEKFSEGLDRASFGKYTLLMNSVSPFLMCYVYKGQSYSAQQRIKYFIDKIHNDELIWQTFEKFYKMSKEVQLKDIPSLEPLLNDIFIEKNIQLTS